MKDPIIPTPCPNCYSLTKTVRGRCGKCKETKSDSCQNCPPVGKFGKRIEQSPAQVLVTKLLADVHTGKFGTKNRSELISRLQAIYLSL